ncbi:MAG: M20 family metallopeptidase [Chloroflexi bacterium]|nr:M20 family metallopeptidase [Chloroflexota bacterium]
MTREAVVAYLNAHRAEMAAQLAHLVHLESPSEGKLALDAQSDYLAQEFGAAGARVPRLTQSETGDHLRLEWGQGGEQALLLGHMDTVWPLGAAVERPFRSEGSRAWGPGCSDMKGGLVVGLWALRALQATAAQPPLRLVYLLNSDEEIGSPTSRPYIEEEARRSRLALVLEPGPKGGVITARKGVGHYSLVVQGRAAHAGNDHAAGVSAVGELAHQVLALHALTDYDRGTTVNVGVVQGGTRSNVVAAEARAEIDLRVTTMGEAERVGGAILGLQPRLPGASVRVHGGLNRPPWPAGEPHTSLCEAYRAVGQALGLALPPLAVGGGSDGNFCAALGVPTLDGLGIAGYGGHSADEWVDLESLPLRAAALACFLAEMQP